MKQLKGILNFELNKKQVIFYSSKGRQEYEDLDEFLYSDFGSKGVAVYINLIKLQAVYSYIKDSAREGYDTKILTVNNSKVIGFSFFQTDRYYLDDKNKKRFRPFKTFYDIKYKIGSDELSIEESLKLIENFNQKIYTQGYTSQLRQELEYEEKLCKLTIDSPPSMAPNIFSKPLVEFKNVQCYDACSFYPYLLTQPLPHFDKMVDLVSESQLEEPKAAFYGKIIIKNVKAKENYFPLTLVGKNNKGITHDKQAKNLICRGQQIVQADEVVLYGFLKDLLQILKQNYYYESYKISSKVIRFELKIDYKLRKKILEKFEIKQAKKRKGESYKGEKILLNRIYGFFITIGSIAPAHYSQYIVSQGRLIINSLIHSIGLKDMVHAHTDSVKFVGDHAAAIEEYNKTVEFEELGKFVLEDTFQKCVYYSHITAKYIDSNGELNFKHGGIDKLGIQNLYKMSYDEINQNTEFFLIDGYTYDKEYGFSYYGTKTCFRKSVNQKEGDDNGR